MRAGGSHRFAIRFIRVQLIRVRWLRRRSVLYQCRVAWVRRSRRGALTPHLPAIARLYGICECRCGGYASARIYR
jgi:hypothetical protein